MKRRLLVYLSLAVLVFLLAGLAFEPVAAKDDTYKYLSNLADTLDLVQRNYVDEVQLDTVLEGARSGLLEELDAESFYVPPTQVGLFKRGPTPPGSLGIDVSKRHGYAVVVSVVPGSPAAGVIKNGDYLRMIDDHSTREMSLFSIQQLLAGPTGSEVRMKVLRRATYDTEQIALKRAPVVAPAMILSEPRPGVLAVRLPRVDAAMVAELSTALRDRPSLHGVVLDLRNCSIGDLPAGASLADLFLDSGTLLRIQGRIGEDRVKNLLSGVKKERSANVPSGYSYVVAASPDSTIWRGPLTVLQDSGTAGPAEVAAMALGTTRATTVGNRSFGRASIQDVVPLQGGGILNLTIASSVTASGDNLLTEGLKPTELVEADSTGDSDPVLDKALELLLPDEIKKKAA